jgi:hypothetical protein
MVRNQCTRAASFYSKLDQTLVPGSLIAQLRLLGAFVFLIGLDEGSVR